MRTLTGLLPLGEAFTLMLDPAEQARLARLFEDLRERLLDLSRRNPMLNYRHQPRSKKQLQIINAVPEELYQALTRENASLDIVGLPEPDDIPPDERTGEFREAFEHAKITDIEYLTRLEALQGTGRNNESEVAKLDRWLRDRVREALDLPRRPDRSTFDLQAHARRLGIDPSIELPPQSTGPTRGAIAKKSSAAESPCLSRTLRTCRATSATSYLSR